MAKAESLKLASGEDSRTHPETSENAAAKSDNKCKTKWKIVFNKYKMRVLSRCVNNKNLHNQISLLILEEFRVKKEGEIHSKL